MRLILIILLFLCGLGFCGIKVYNHFSSKANATPEQLRKEREQFLRKEGLATSDSDSAPGSSSPTPPPVAPVVAALPGTPVEASQIGSYVFKNRVAPLAPNFLRAEGSKIIVETDKESNSWVWIGTPLFSDQITQLGKEFDRKQVEMDLEFVLVLISTDRLKSRGISIFYRQDASFLDVLNLTGDAGSLRISSGSWGVDLEYGDKKSGVSLLSQPVIRCLDGQPWRFATDTQVPIPRSEFVDGVLRQVIEYRPIGFGLDGTVRIVGEKVLLEIKQRNGSVTPASSDRTNDAPIFQDQVLETSLQLAWWEWSVLGGIQVDKEQTRKGLFRDSLQVTSDYLVIFARPRLALETPPKAVPVYQAQDLHPLESFPRDLLPEKGWQNYPDGIAPAALPLPSK